MQILFRISFLFLFSLLCHFSHAQFNIKVGYSFAYTEGEAINRVFNRYNDDNPWFEQKFDEFHYFNGLDLGLRYRWYNLGVTADFTNLSKRSEGLGTNPATSSFFSDQWDLNNSGYSIGLETHFGAWAWGANIGYKTLKVETDISGSKNEKTIYKESELTSKFYLSLSLPSNSTAISIQPYVQLPWKKYNIQSVEKEIFPDSQREENLFDEELVFYGISIVFYNGPQ